MYHEFVLFSDERVGNLVYVVKDSSTAERMKSQFELIVRQIWSNPPAHGARIVATVLNNTSLTADW